MSVELRSNLFRDQLLERDGYWHSNSARVNVHVWPVTTTSACICVYILEHMSLSVSMELFKRHGRTGNIIKYLAGKELNEWTNL